MYAMTFRILFPIILVLGLAACSRSEPVLPNVEVEVPAAGPAHAAIIFIHGIMGNAAQTFRNSHAQQGWPEMLAADKTLGQPVQVTSLAYESQPLSLSGNIHEIATRLQTRLQDKGVFENNDKVIFVAHSMGGLVAKQMLLQLSRDNPSAYEKVAGIFFLATPAGGSDLADVMAWVSVNPQFRDMSSMDFNTFLNSQEDDWNAMLRKRTELAPYPKAFCLYEKLPIGPVVVVPRSRAQLSCDECPVTFDRNHVDLVKPSSATDEVYEYVAARIRKILGDEYVPLKLSVSRMAPSGEKLSDFAHLRGGDSYFIKIDSTKPVWFYVFAQDSTGRFERYFPAPEKTGKQVGMTTSIRVPIDDKKVFMLDNNSGWEHIFVFGSISRSTSLETMGTEVTSGHSSAGETLDRELIDHELIKRGARVVPVPQQKPVGSWQQLEVSGTGDEATSQLSFWHE